MAAGDVWVKTDSDVDASEFFDMQPSTGSPADATETIIHNVTVNQAAGESCVLEFWDGATAFAVDTITGNGSWMGVFLHNTESKFYRVNPGSNNAKICADGVVTK